VEHWLEQVFIFVKYGDKNVVNRNNNPSAGKIKEYGFFGGLKMNISNEEAQSSLEQVQAAASHTRKTINAAYDSGILIMWGIIMIAAFLGTHFFGAWAGYIWMGFCGTGCIATLFVSWRQFRLANPVKVPATEKIGWRIFLFWSLLFVYIFIWLSILRPYRARQLNAFVITAIMFSYIVMGLWFKSYHMFWLGVVVTGITLIGFYLIPWSYYCFWMAAMGGGAFLVTGISVRLRSKWSGGSTNITISGSKDK
jgi:hypothetical protein